MINFQIQVISGHHGSLYISCRWGREPVSMKWQNWNDSAHLSLADLSNVKVSCSKYSFLRFKMKFFFLYYHDKTARERCMWCRFATSLYISIQTSVWCLFNLQHENIRIYHQQLHLMKRSCWKTLCKRAQPQLNKLQNRRIKSLRNTFWAFAPAGEKIIHLYLFRFILYEMKQFLLIYFALSESRWCHQWQMF